MIGLGLTALLNRKIEMENYCPIKDGDSIMNRLMLEYSEYVATGGYDYADFVMSDKYPQWRLIEEEVWQSFDILINEKEKGNE